MATCRCKTSQKGVSSGVDEVPPPCTNPGTARLVPVSMHWANCLKTTTLIAGLMLSGLAYAQTPGDVVFELRATRTPAVYQIGERIELELSFSAPVPGKYGITTTAERREAS